MKLFEHQQQAVDYILGSVDLPVIPVGLPVGMGQSFTLAAALSKIQRKKPTILFLEYRNLRESTRGMLRNAMPDAPILQFAAGSARKAILPGFVAWQGKPTSPFSGEPGQAKSLPFFSLESLRCEGPAAWKERSSNMTIFMADFGEVSLLSEYLTGWFDLIVEGEDFPSQYAASKSAVRAELGQSMWTLQKLVPTLKKLVEPEAVMDVVAEIHLERMFRN
jgi:hypothetical protein